MQAWLRVFNSWMPDFLIDNHVTDGADFQYDVTWDMARNQDLADAARAWVRDRFVPELDRRLAADGHLAAPYGALRNAGEKREFFMEVFSPRYSHLYAAVQNRPALLVESHSLKAAKTRAWAHYDIMRHSIEIILQDPESLRRAVRESDREMAARAGDRNASPVYLAGRVASESRPLVYHSLKSGPFKSQVTGANVTRYLPEPDDLETRHPRQDRNHRARPACRWAISSPRHGRAWRTCWRCTASKRSASSNPSSRSSRPTGFPMSSFAATPFEGHIIVNFEARPVQEKIAIPAGSWWVPMKQRRARLVLSMLEPQAPDSLARWGLWISMFDRRRRGSSANTFRSPSPGA